MGSGSALSLSGTATATFDNASQRLASLGSGSSEARLVLDGGVLTLTGNSSFAGTISGGGTLRIDGGGTVDLGNNANNYGGTTVIAGTLQAGNSSPFGPAGAAIVVQAAGALDVNGQAMNAAHYRVAIIGGGAGGNGTIVNSGPAAVAALDDLTLDGDAAVGGGGRWDLRSSSDTRGATLDGNGFSLTKVGENTIVVAGNATGMTPASGAALVTNVKDIVIDAGMLGFEENVTVNNATPGSIIINSGGTLGVGNAGGMYGVSVQKPLVFAGGTLQTDDASAANGNAAIDAPITLDATALIDAQAGSTLMLDGVIADGAPAPTTALTLEGAGIVVFGSPNTYTGITTLLSGTVVAANSTPFGSGIVVMTDEGPSIQLSGGVNIANPLTIAGGGADAFGALRSSLGVNTWSGPITLGDDNSRLGAAAGATLIASGPISGAAGNGLIVKTDDSTGTVVLSNASSTPNSWGAATQIIEGTLRIAADDDQLATNQPLQLGNNAPFRATLDLNGFNQTVAGLQDREGQSPTTEFVTNGAAATASTITLAIPGGVSTFSGTIADGAGTVAVAKSGLGVQIVNGVNSYSGPTTISGGILAAGFPGAGDRTGGAR